MIGDNTYVLVLNSKRFPDNVGIWNAKIASRCWLNITYGNTGVDNSHLSN